MNLVAVFGVVGVEGRLNVSRGPHDGLDATIEVKDVVESVVVTAISRASHVYLLADSRHAAQGKSNVFGRTDVCRGGVTLDQVTLIGFEESNATAARLAELGSVESGVHAVRVEGNIETRDLRKGVRAETVVCVEIRCPALHWILPCIVGYGLLKSQLINDSLAFVLDVVEAHPRVTRERHEEGKVHPLDVLLCLVHLEPLARWLDAHWRR